MKVKELMGWLQALDPELMVVVDGYEGGVKEATYVELETIALNVNDEWYYGSHEVIVDGDRYEDKERAQAVHIV
jgi:hypothetical protein